MIIVDRTFINEVKQSKNIKPMSERRPKNKK